MFFGIGSEEFSEDKDGSVSHEQPFKDQLMVKQEIKTPACCQPGIQVADFALHVIRDEGKGSCMSTFMILMWKRLLVILLKRLKLIISRLIVLLTLGKEIQMC